MAFITLLEIFGIVVVTAVVGYIFSGYLQLYLGGPGSRLNWQTFRMSLIVAAPSIILHELAHKFVGLAFGLPAMFQVFWEGLGLALILRWINSPILLLAPAYVVVPNALPIESFFIAFAGPAANLVLWLIPSYYLKQNSKMNKKKLITLAMTKQINKWLFIFNMIPIPPLDGFNVVSSLWRIIF